MTHLHDDRDPRFGAPEVWHPPHDPRGRAPEKPPSALKKLLGPLGVAVILILKFAGKLKFIILPLFKFLPLFLKTGGTMILSIGVYAMFWGWRFALGFVLLLLVHESGHLVAARMVGLKVGAPVFIPFMGALIALKEAPRNAWIESWVAYGGPLVGSLGALACLGIYALTGNPLFKALAYVGFFLNLFNLIPFGFLDGGRIVTAISPWITLVGIVLIGALLFFHPSFLLVLIVLMSLPRVFSLFRRKSAAEERWYEVTWAQRLVMSTLYFGLVAALVVGMTLTHFTPAS